MFALDLAKLQTTPLRREPFDFLVVPGILRDEAKAAIQASFPRIAKPGSFPPRALHFGSAFRTLLDELRSRAVREAFEEKFQLSLQGRPTVVTIRGRCGPNDGRIHTDLPGKIVTVLLYLNPTWEEAGGRLRLLRSADNLEDVLLEVPPVEGTLLAFRRSDNSFHGHKPFVGERRVLQLNWVTWQHYLALRRQDMLERCTGWLKWLVPMRSDSSRRAHRAKR